MKIVQKNDTTFEGEDDNGVPFRVRLFGRKIVVGFGEQIKITGIITPCCKVTTGELDSTTTKDVEIFVRDASAKDHD